MADNTIWRLLRRNISAAQLAGYALANLAGLAIVVSAIQFYGDITSAWGDGEDAFLTRDYMVVSRKVSGLGSLVGSGDKGGFTPGEISDLAREPWVRRVAPFTASDFSVTAAMDTGGGGLSSALFFESIPDEYFDIRPEGWGFDPASPEIPIIISKDYLSLYNFGFASSRGLPQLSEAMIGMVPLKVSVSGNGRQRWIPAHIAGFSSRLNTIAVPEEFMTWANAEFGDGDTALPSRLIVEVSRPGDPAIKQYLSEHDYDMSGSGGNDGKASYFLNVVTATVISVGTVICILAFFILTLSIGLLLQKNRDKLRDLMLLGYSPDMVARYYYIIIAAINASVLTVAVILMLAARHMWSGPLASLGMHVSSPLRAVMTAAAIIIVITAANIITVRRTMLRYFKS